MFQGVDIVQDSLAKVYGAEEVTLTNATIRWLNHHSAMKSDYCGMEYLTLGFDICANNMRCTSNMCPS